MSGTIYRRGQSWCVGFTVNGRRVRETVGPNKRIAERVLSLRMTQVLENRYFPPSRQLGRMPFKDFAQVYLEREGPLLKSIRTERNRVLAWAREFRSRPLGQIARAEIEAWRRERMSKCRTSTINRFLSRLRRLFSLAVEWELLEESPMKGMKFLRENNARTRYLSLEECQRLIANCIAPHIRALVTVALHSGMRLGEILTCAGMIWTLHLALFWCETRRMANRGTLPMMRPCPHSSEPILVGWAQTWCSLVDLAAASWMFGQDS